MDLDFTPNETRARLIDQRMRHELATSLAHVAKSIQTQLPESEAARRCGRIAPAIQLLRSGQRVNPELFATYYRLVIAALEGQDDLADWVDRTIASAESREGLTFRDLSESGMGGADRLALYITSLDTDERLSVAFLPPDPKESSRTKASVLRALNLMHETVPELAGEFDAIVTEVLLAAAAKEKGAARFDGASSYMLWGALALSVDDEKSDLEMMETLAHEASHSFLFGLTVEEPLVRNDDNHLYPSPLRPDPRPMDGIYHATYVSARMHYAVDQARLSGLLDDGQMAESDVRLAASAKAFEDGYSVVSASGDLTETGRIVMDHACRYMESVSA
jgi:HEXXH motif-containing protein